MAGNLSCAKFKILFQISASSALGSVAIAAGVGFSFGAGASDSVVSTVSGGFSADFDSVISVDFLADFLVFN